MDTEETPHFPADSAGYGPVQCEACKAALQTPGRESISFLLVDQYTIPLVGCDTHVEQFRALCELATDDSADLLPHRPAGGLQCPGCRHAAHRTEQLIVPVGGGGLAVPACESHQSDILMRFQAGQEIQYRLTAPIDAW